MSDAPTELEEFPKVDGFTITRMLSRTGGTVEVYLAKQHGNDRLVILKCLRENDPAGVEQFRKEVNSQSQIDHPNIVTICTQQEAHGRLFIAMEFMQGGDLSEAIAQGMSEQQIVQTLISLSSALDATHRKGIIHRDIKPENILLKADGTAKLSGFGSSCTIDKAQVEPVNTGVGPSKYMSPEQIKGQPIDGRSDLYSLGLVLYELLTRQCAYDGESVESMRLKSMSQPQITLPKSLSHWQCILDKLTDIDPSKRYQEAQEVIDDVSRLADLGEPGAATTSRSRLVPGLIFLLVAVIAATIFLMQGNVGNGPLVNDLADVASQEFAAGYAQPGMAARSDIELSTRLLVPYDQTECRMGGSSELDFVPYTNEPLYEWDCLRLSTVWNGVGTYHLLSDLTGEGNWVQLYPNSCGNLGLPARLPANEKVYFPSTNGLASHFSLDDNARPFHFVSLVVVEDDSTVAFNRQFSALPSICNVPSEASQTISWDKIQVWLDQEGIADKVRYETLWVNHQARK